MPSEPFTPESLLRLGKWLRGKRYEFTTVTPSTHDRILRRAPERAARNLRDAFGWNLLIDDGEARSFPELSAVDRTELFTILREGNLLSPAQATRTPGPAWRSRVRFSTLGHLLLAHSSFPTSEENSVFFGPDTYRFARLLEQQVKSAGHLLDLGAGGGAGGLSLASRCEQITLSDVSDQALVFARANAEINGLSPEIVKADGVPPVRGNPYDVIVCNPPFLVDDTERAYRHGGGKLGEELSLRFMRQALPALGPGGRFIMYTGSAIVAGRDHLREEAARIARDAGASLDYFEIDPDIFPEELEREVYALTERICAVGLRVSKRAVG